MSKNQLRKNAFKTRDACGVKVVAGRDPSIGMTHLSRGRQFAKPIIGLIFTCYAGSSSEGVGAE